MPLDYSSYGFNPYNFNFQNCADQFSYESFLKAYQSPNSNNPAFKGGTITDTTSVTYPNIIQTGGTTQVNGGIPISTTPAEQSSGLAGTLLGAAIFTAGAGTCIWAARKGKFGQAWDAIKKMVGKGTAEEGNAAVENCLKKMTAYKDSEGNMRIMIPGKKGKPIVGETAIREFAQKNYAQEAITAERQAFNPQSAIRNVHIKVGDDVYKVTVKNGEIVKIVDAKYPNVNWTDVLTKVKEDNKDKKIMEQIEKTLAELKKETPDEEIISNVSYINYTNTFGDNVLEMRVPEYGKTPVLRSLTTLERFTPKSEEFRTTALKDGEEFFSNSEFLAGGKLVDGAKVGTYPIEKLAGKDNYTGNFNGRELVSITEKTASGKEITYPKGSQGYNLFVEDEANKKAIKKIINGIFEKKDNIPNGMFISSV